MRARPEGVCCLCLTYGPLSFEHVPPRSAFNEHAVFVAETKRLFGRDWWTEMQDPKGRKEQRGAGRFSLCEPCNNQTGSWYAAAYVEFVRYFAPAMAEAAAGDVIAVPMNIRPQQVLKQIFVMFCSACGPAFAENQPDLVRYLLNKDAQELPQKLDIYLGLQDRKSVMSRQAGITVRAGLTDASGLSIRTYAEISFPPLVILMSVDTPSPDARLHA